MFCLFDVDKFKAINDTFGHVVGDEVLVAIANCMKNTFRDRDIIMRLGGDEFVAVIIGKNSKEYIVSVATTILEAITNSPQSATIIIKVYCYS